MTANNFWFQNYMEKSHQDKARTQNNSDVLVYVKILNSQWQLLFTQSSRCLPLIFQSTTPRLHACICKAAIFFLKLSKNTLEWRFQNDWHAISSFRS